MRDIKPGQCHWYISSKDHQVASGVLRFKSISSINGRICSILSACYNRLDCPLVCVYEVMTKQGVDLYRMALGYPDEVEVLE